MKKKYYNISIDVLSKNQFFNDLKLILNKQSDSPIVVNFLNAHCFNVAQKDEDYLNALNSSTFLLNDGIGVQIGACLLGFKFPDNLNGTDLIPEILKILEEHDSSVYFLGAKPKVIEVAVNKIREKMPNLNVAGYHSGYYESERDIVLAIKQSGARVVVLGMGVPKQELWVYNHISALQNVQIFVSGGAIFDFVSGSIQRAPAWIRALRMEWGYRLLKEPRRLFRRYIIGNFEFLGRILYLRCKGGR